MTEAAGTGVDTGPAPSAWAREALVSLMSLDDVGRAGLAVLEGGGRRLNFTSSDRAGDSDAHWCHVDAYDDVPLNTAVRTGRAVLGSMSELADSYPQFVERQRDSGSRALAAVPVVAAGHTLGGFVLFFRTAPTFDDSAVAKLIALGAELGAALRRDQGERVRPPGEWGREAAPGASVVEFHVPCDPTAIRTARQELGDALRGWGVDEDATDTAVLCLSELVTNAVVHGGSGCSVHVMNEAGVITVAVRNAGPSLQLVTGDAPDPLQVHGRGLQLVGGLASRWGSELDTTGMTVWFVLEL